MELAIFNGHLDQLIGVEFGDWERRVAGEEWFQKKLALLNMQKAVAVEEKGRSDDIELF